MMKSEYEYGDKVKLNPEVLDAELYYGHLDDLDIFKHSPGKVIKIQYDDKACAWSYQIQFENMEVDNKHWFLERELTEHE